MIMQTKDESHILGDFKRKLKVRTLHKGENKVSSTDDNIFLKLNPLFSIFLINYLRKIASSASQLFTLLYLQERCSMEILVVPLEGAHQC